MSILHCTNVRLWFSVLRVMSMGYLQVLVQVAGSLNGLSAPLWQPGTRHGKGPTLSGFLGQNLQWSFRLLALVKPAMPQLEQLDWDFFRTLWVGMWRCNASLVAKVDLQPFLGQNTVLGTWQVMRCLSRDLLELNFLPHPGLGQMLCWVPRWVFRCLL